MVDTVVKRVLMSKRVAMRFLDQSLRPVDMTVAVFVGDSRRFIQAVRQDRDLRCALNKGDIVYHCNSTNVLFTGADRKRLVGVFRVACNLNLRAEILGHGNTR